MKQLYILTTFLLLFSFNLNAQTVTITGSCNPIFDGDYSYAGDINGRPSYAGNQPNTAFIIVWSYLSEDRWELYSYSFTNGLILQMHNNLDSPNPPSSSLSPWIGDACDPPGTFSGDGTSNPLSIENTEYNAIKIYPNPATEIINIKKLKNVESYKIYNLLGSQISNGTISENGQIDIKNLSKGLYFLKFSNGSTIKFIKK